MKREYKKRTEHQEAFDREHAESLERSRSTNAGRIACIVIIGLVGMTAFFLWLSMSNGTQSARQTTSYKSPGSNSPTPRQVFGYCENLWNTALATGNPISDDFNNPVFDSAADHFGISTDKVRVLYSDESSSRSGIPNPFRE